MLFGPRIKNILGTHPLPLPLLPFSMFLDPPRRGPNESASELISLLLILLLSEEEERKEEEEEEESP